MLGGWTSRRGNHPDDAGAPPSTISTVALLLRHGLKLEAGDH